MRASILPDVFDGGESGLNHLQSIIDPLARVTAISLLPPWVLVRVFHFLTLDEPSCSRKEGLGWIRVTHVCSLWRQIALGDLSLWARISGLALNTMLASEMLARAKNAPLVIDIDLEEMSSPDVLHMLPPHLPHTRELRLHSLSMLHSDSVRAIYDQEAPALEHFELGVSAISLITLQELDGTTLFKGRAPKLRTLILSQVLIPWSLIPHGQLTQLTVSLSNEACIVPSRHDLNQLVDLLVDSSGLEVLVLESCLPSRLSQFLPFGETIHLPRISRLSLGGSSSRITNLLKMLRLPSSAMLHLRCISENTSTYTDYHLLPVILAHLQSSDPIEFKYLSVTLDYRNLFLEVTASTSGPISGFSKSQDFESPMDDHNDLVLSFDGLLEIGDWADIIEQVCNKLPISNLEFLSISAPDVVEPLNLVELFKRCTKVTTMQAIGRGTSSLVRALAVPKVAPTLTLDAPPTFAPEVAPKVKNTRHKDSRGKNGWKQRKKRREARQRAFEQSARSGAAQVSSNSPLSFEPFTFPLPIERIFPELAFLSLRRIGFAEIERPTGIVFDMVERALRQRMVTYKAPLKLLCIDDCAISTKRVRALQELVHEFHWDEEERFLDEIDDSDDYYLEFDDYSSGT